MSGIKPDIFLREKWTSQATDGHCYKSVDRLHSNAVRRPKQKRHHNPLAQHNPFGRLQPQSLNGQICIAAITQRPIQRRPQFIETRSITCQWTKQTKRFASCVQQIIHPQTGGWRIRLIVLHIWSVTSGQHLTRSAWHNFPLNVWWMASSYLLKCWVLPDVRQFKHTCSTSQGAEYCPWYLRRSQLFLLFTQCAAIHWIYCEFLFQSLI